MLKITLTEEQLKALFGCLDVSLRQGGLSVMSTIVDLYNVLSHPQKEEDVKEE
jgi:hypothetical protein